MGTTTPRSRKRILQLPAIALAVSLAGCGGGGDSGGVGVGGELAFAVKWQRPGGAAAGFEDPIPPSVDAIRIIIDPESAAACCIAVLRGSQAFEERHLAITSIPAGDATVEVFGFPANFAPNDGVTATCSTRTGDGTACSNNDTLASFGSDETPVEVMAGQSNRVDIDVYSLPFLIEFNIEPGEDVTDQPIRFTVVDANFPINPDVEVTIDGDDLAIHSSEPCADGGGPVLPDCSDGGELEVQGLEIVARLDTFDLSGAAELRIVARNTGVPPRQMVSSTPVVLSGGTTTTSTTSSTTTSTTETTTTTLGGDETFCLDFSVSNEVDLIGISFTATYSSTGGDFFGSHEDVECVSLLTTDTETTLASFNDNDQVSLAAALISAETFSAPTALARCVFHQMPPLNLAGFSIQVTEATAPDLTSASATVIVEESTCPD